MAKIGLNNFRYAVISDFDTLGAPVYGTVKTPAKAISANVSISNNDAKLFADDALAESDTSFQSGTVTIGIDNEDLETMANLLGHNYASGVILRNSNDVAPYVGFGRVVTKMVNGVYKYKVEFLYKVKFSEPSQEDQTKGESLEFNTTEIEGQVLALTSGLWSYAKVFDSKDAAVTALEGLFANFAPANFNISGLASSAITLHFVDGMTWEEWVASDYNTIGATIGTDDHIYCIDTHATTATLKTIKSGSTAVAKTATIVSGTAYTAAT